MADEVPGPQSLLDSKVESVRSGAEELDSAQAITAAMNDTPRKADINSLGYDSIEVQSLINEPFSFESFKRACASAA